MTPAAGDALAAAAGLRRRAAADLAGGRATRAVRDLTAALRLVTTAGPGARSPGGDRDPGRVSLHVACLLTMAVARLQTDGVSAAHRMLDEVPVADHVVRYVLRLVRATRVAQDPAAAAEPRSMVIRRPTGTIVRSPCGDSASASADATWPPSPSATCTAHTNRAW